LESNPYEDESEQVIKSNTSESCYKPMPLTYQSSQIPSQTNEKSNKLG